MNSRRRFFLIIFILVISWHSAAQARTAGLWEIYEQAVRYSLELKSYETQIEQARGRYLQALGTLTPVLDAEYTEVYQDKLSGSFASSLNQYRQPYVRTGIKVPIFQGFREIAALRFGKPDKALQKERLREAKRNLFADVASTYFTALELQQDLTRENMILQIYKKRLNDLKMRVDQGKARSAEFLEQELEYDLTLARREEIKGRWSAIQEVLRLLTGWTGDLHVVQKNIPHDKNLNQNLLLSEFSKRPDILALQNEIQIRKGDKLAKTSNLLPRIDGESNYYPYRTGFLQDVKWDASLKVSIPIFNLVNIGSLKESRHMLQQKEFELQNRMRQVESEIKQKWQAYTAARRISLSYENAARTAQKHFELVANDDENGRVTHLDVLNAQKNLVESLRARDTARINHQRIALELKIAAGVLP